jgi:hypothetical protein
MYEGEKEDIVLRAAGEVTRSCSCPQKTKVKVLTSCLHAKSDEDIDLLCHLANISVKNIKKAAKAHTYQCHMLRDPSNVYQCEHIIKVDDQCTSFWLVSRCWGLTILVNVVNWAISLSTDNYSDNTIRKGHTQTFAAPPRHPQLFCDFSELSAENEDK